MRRHGMSHTRLHNIWLTMRQRCEKPRCNGYYKYGAKGIKVCEAWSSFESFRDWAMEHGYRDDFTIDRIDPKGNYEPSNCRWATQKEQQNNRLNNIRIEHQGVTHTIYEWSILSNLPRRIIYDRYRRNWKTERIFGQPVRKSPTKIHRERVET